MTPGPVLQASPYRHVTVTLIMGCREQCQALIDSAVSFLNLVSLN